MKERLVVVVVILFGMLTHTLWFSLIIWAYTHSNLGIIPYSFIATVVTMLLKWFENKALISWDKRKLKRDADQIVSALTANTEYLGHKN
jgi:hypothetical protein